MSEKSPYKIPVNMGMTGRLALATAATAFGTSFQFGYLAFEGPIAYGGIVGALLSGIIADTIGRKNGMLLNILPASVFLCLVQFATLEWILEACPLLLGFCFGVNAGIAPMYLVEISPTNLRGAVGTVYQLALTIAALLGLQHFFGYFSIESHSNWVFISILIPTIFQICTLPFCPESPRFTFFNKGNEIEAQKALIWLRGTNDVQDELNEMRCEYAQIKSEAKINLKEILSNPALRMPLFISCVMMLAQQLSGYHTIMFISTIAFLSLGFTQITIYLAAMAAVSVIMTGVSMFTVEKVGRKIILLFGLCGMFTSFIFLYVINILNMEFFYKSYLIVCLGFLFVGMYALGPASIPWFLTSELCNHGTRPIATSIAVTINMIVRFCIGLPFCQMALNESVFLVFAGLLVLFIAFTWFKVPETKGKTVQEIGDYFKDRSSSFGQMEKLP